MEFVAQSPELAQGIPNPHTYNLYIMLYIKKNKQISSNTNIFKVSLSFLM